MLHSPREQTAPEAPKLPKLHFWQIWSLCFGFAGIQFCFALQNANVSRIFQSLGASVEDIPILWVAAPITGLLIQPIVGYLSDNTWNRFGRRRPFLIAGAFAAATALLVMPNSTELWMAAAMLWILDASLNVMLGPSVALVGDMLPEEQRSSGFSMQSFFIGVSAVVASAMPWTLNHWFDVTNTTAGKAIPDSVTYAFYIGAAIVLFTVLWTCVSTREYSPEQLQREKHSLGEKWQDTYNAAKNQPRFLRQGTLFTLSGALATLAVLALALDKKLLILTLGIVGYGAFQLLAANMYRRRKYRNGLYQIMHDILEMPTTMRQLAVVQFFTWFALFSLWIYGTPAVASFHFGASDANSALYNEGANWVGILFATYNGFAALAAIAIPWMISAIGIQRAHILNLVLGAGAMLSFLWIRDPQWLLVSMVAMGFAWASILAIPYSILTCTLPQHKMGTYAGIFNLFIVIPQILASSLLALVVHHLFAGQAIYVLGLAGLLLLVAAGATCFVRIESAPAEAAGSAAI
ncbi:MFS transporter [Microbulbifer sp. CAU 1566]|uniref:MFS transporter n=1 Tax=Microbulbifer sp. CAU 1566 TaxID=2933269 RepID=UPI002003B4CC|nr:MFS transporter [Microbulbifer sp. CAU 1566]MCK7598580.1 MFS transporter [Microbulbifer sp. CAU 1566]